MSIDDASLRERISVAKDDADWAAARLRELESDYIDMLEKRLSNQSDEIDMLNETIEDLKTRSIGHQAEVKRSRNESKQDETQAL